MAENIGVIMIFIIILMMGLGFYTFYKVSSINNEKEQNAIKNAIEIAQRVAFLPELQCGEDIVKREDCIDLFKAIAVTETGIFDSYASKIYFPILDYSEITIKEIYPNEGSEYVLYNRPKPKYDVKKYTPVPITIYDPIRDAYSLGVLEVTVYG